MSVLNRASSEAGKAEGMIRAEAGAPAGWIAKAVEKIRRAALKHAFLTADDVWSEGLEHPEEARALGPCFTRARALGIVEPTEMFVLTTQTKRHSAPVRVWKSLLFRDPGQPWTRERVREYIASRGKGR